MISDGGCPCANNDEMKCGASEYYSGYCSRACCDWTVEEACFDDNNKLLGCARYDQGGCRNEKQRKIARWPEPAPRETNGMHPSPSLTSTSQIISAPAPQPSQRAGTMGMRPRPSLTSLSSGLSQV